MSQKLDKQKENVNSLLKLIAENPELRIVPMVDSEIVADDNHSWWSGSWGISSVDEMWISDERVYVKDMDCDELEEEYINNLTDEECKNLSDEEIQAKATEYVDNLPWEKVITININLPEEWCQ